MNGQPALSFIKINSESVPELKTFIESSDFDNLIQSNNFLIGDINQITSNENYVFWTIDFFQTGSDNQHILAIYPLGSTTYKLLLRLSVDNGGQRLKAINISDGVTIVNALVNSGSPNPPPPPIQNCREEHRRLHDCMECAINRLIDDWIGIVACGVRPLLCATAALIHCTR
jgi:hypothetical protein